MMTSYDLSLVLHVTGKGFQLLFLCLF
jgi:hypothetical protein